MRPCPDTCPECGLSYDNFRTGETFASVKEAMHVANDDTSTWRYRTRRMVLGCWHATKLRLWAAHVAECEHYARLEAAERNANATHDRMTGRAFARGFVLSRHGWSAAEDAWSGEFST